MSARSMDPQHDLRPTPSRQPRPLDPMRIIHWASGATMSSALPISDPTPDPGLFGPDTVTWRLHTEQWLIAAGGRAFLLQAAHPVVAQGALDHSRFAEDPYGRVAITARVMLTYAATIVVGLAAQQAGRPDLIRSPKRVLAHTWEGLLECVMHCPRN